MPDPTDATIQCWQCGSTVPHTAFCVVCGHSLAEESAARAEADRHFRAAPDEPARSFRVFSTLFPQLPRAELDAFRTALVIGTAVVLALTLLGFYPVAVLVAAAIVPLLVLIYVYEVDVYEDEPPLVIGATFVWGVVAGALLGVVARDLADAGPLIPVGDRTNAVVQAVLLGGLQVVLSLLGPLALLRYRRFNDVLDGATFGVASAAGFAAAYTIVLALDLVAAGLQPGGETSAWLVTTLNVALIRPLLLVAVVGATCAAFWLRFRGPERDRAAMGLLGSPWVAVLTAAGLIALSGATNAFLGSIAGTAVRAGLAVAALLWLRGMIHLGLRQEAAEVPIGAAILCANCGRETARHSFCGSCGISLRALPKERRRRKPAEPEPAP